MTDNTQPEAGSTHIIRYALELGLLWIDGDGRGKVREALDALDTLESQLEAVGAGGVQALSAAPEAIAKLRHLYQNMVNGAVRDTASAKRIAEGLLAPAIEALERATPPAEQQAAPKAAPGEPSDADIDAFLDSPGGIEWVIADKRERYRLLVRAVLAKWAAPQQEAQEPVAWLNPWRADKVTTDYDAYGERGIPLYTAPQPAPAPLSEMPYEKRKAIQEGEQIGASDAWFHARHNMLDTLDRRNVFRAGFDRGWNAALAAQGGSK